MRHRKAGVKLNRTTSHRQAMFRNMVTSLFKYDRIKTTDAKAKELRRWADHIITLAKRGDLNARRQALAIVREKDVVHKLFEEAQKRFGKTNGGYTRITKLGLRPGDAASVSLIELITVEAKPKKKKKKAAPKKQAAAPAAAKKADEKPADEKAADDAPKKADAKDDAVKAKAADDKKEAKPKAAKPAAKAKAPTKKAPAKKAPAKKAAPKAKAPAKKAAPKAKAPAKKASPEKE